MSKTPYIFYTMDNIDETDLIDEQGHLNGTLDGAVQTEDGYIYDALDFDGSSKVTCGPHPGLTDNMAISFFCKFDALGTNAAYYSLAVVSSGALNTGIGLVRTYNAARIHMVKSYSTGSPGGFQVFTYNNASNGHTPDMDTWYHYFCQYNSNTSEYEFWVDGSAIFTTSPSIFGSSQSDYNGVTIGKNLDCQIDHVKIFDLSSSGPLSESEIQALRDEEEFHGQFSGYVYELGNPVSRQVYLHYRPTGALMDSTTSSGNGYYYLETTYSGAHYIVCLDDAAGEDYNDLIIGNVYPTTISG